MPYFAFASTNAVLVKKIYNNERIQLKTKLTPLEKRCQFVP